MTPRYPIYVISKGRATQCFTAKMLIRSKVPFMLIIEPQEEEVYRHNGYGTYLRTLPFSNLGQGSIPARNWVWEHAKETGVDRHWIIDDNIRHIYRKVDARRIICAAGPALACVEDFCDRYENVAIGGLNYKMFGLPDQPPFYLNTRVYSCLLIKNDLPYRWRGRYNEDTDLCLQVLTSGTWCTVQFNVFLTDKIVTMKLKGGNTDELYKGDGRLTMARSLERMWPGIVSVKRRFQRPQHVVKKQWELFDTPLRRRTDIDWTQFEGSNNYGLVLKAVRDFKNPETERWYRDRQAKS